MEEQIRAEEGIHKDFSDYEDDDEGGVYEDDNSSVEYFYSDESNKDQSDDDLIFERNVDEGAEDILDEDSGEDIAANLDDNCDTDQSSIYANSDEKRMCGNSTDDEDNIQDPVFNEDVDMANLVFELGMCFKSSGVFRKAVKKHAIIKRRPIINVKNYGKKKSDDMRKAAAEGIPLQPKKVIVKCKNYSKTGHNSKNCTTPKRQLKILKNQEEEKATPMKTQQEKEQQERKPEKAMLNNEPTEPSF